MAKLLRDRVVLPPGLAVFDPTEWGPVPGATLEACRCSACIERWGPGLPPDDSTTVGAARRRWREARIAYLREALGTDDPVYRFEVLESIREQYASSDLEETGRP